MWSFNWEGGMEEVNDGSGLVRRRLVVRRAEDSWRRVVKGRRPASDGKRNGRLAGGRRGRKTFMSLLSSMSKLENHLGFNISGPGDPGLLVWHRTYE